MKKIILLAGYIAIVVLCSGCASTITYYDENGKITKIEETSNFARVMDGTNNKSQLVLVDGTFIGFEASAAAGENCTPGISTKYVNGKIAFINQKDNATFNGPDEVVKEFFASGVKISTAGIEKK